MGGLDKRGVFSFNSNEKEKINALEMRGLSTILLKKIDVVAYLIEITYNLAILPADNVSQF